MVGAPVLRSEEDAAGYQSVRPWRVGDSLSQAAVRGRKAFLDIKPYTPRRMIELAMTVAGVALIFAELVIWDVGILWHEPKRDRRNFPPPR